MPPKDKYVVIKAFELQTAKGQKNKNYAVGDPVPDVEAKFIDAWLTAEYIALVDRTVPKKEE